MGGKKNKTKNSRSQGSSQPKRKSKPRSSDAVTPFSFARTGASLGKHLGNAAGSILGKIFGMGAYTIERNALLSANGTVGPPPVFQTSTDGSVIVCHREFVTNINGSLGFTMQLQQPINPANPNLFPRLAQLAPNFEEYEPLGLIFEYVTTSGTAVGSTNTALGTVMMATNYDVLSPPFQNQQDLESYKYSTPTVPCNSALHGVECKPSQLVSGNRYIGDPSSYAAGTASGLTAPFVGDQRLYDLGLFQIATQGQQATNLVGQIWVSYCFKFMIGRRNPYNSMLHIYSPTNIATAAAPLLGCTVSPGSTITTVLTNTTFTLPTTGRFLVSASWLGLTITGSPTLIFGTNIINKTCFNNYGDGSAPCFNNSNRGVVMQVFYVLANGTSTANTITVTGLPTMTDARVDIYVTRVPEVGPGFF